MRNRPMQPIAAAMRADESDPTLVGAWCQPGARSALVDTSSAGNDMSIVGAAKLGRHNSFIGDATTAYLRKAVAGWRSADLAGTIELWFKRTTYGAATCAYLCTTDEASATDRFAIYLTSNVLWVRSCSSGTMIPDGFTGTDNEFSTASTISAGQWCQGVITSTGSAYQMYLNGVEITTSWHAGANNGQWIGRVLNRDAIVIGADTSNAGTTHYNNDEVVAVAAYSETKSASWVARRFRAAVPDSTLRIQIPYGDQDYSRYRTTLTRSGGVIVGTRMPFDGTDDKIACGDVGTISEVSMWVNPGSTSEQLFRTDTGNSVAVVSGTITYTGLTASATYVNGVAGTTLAANTWQHVVCQFTASDANNLDLGWDGTNYGDIEVRDFCARTSARSADIVLREYVSEREDY